MTIEPKNKDFAYKICDLKKQIPNESDFLKQLFEKGTQEKISSEELAKFCEDQNVYNFLDHKISETIHYFLGEKASQAYWHFADLAAEYLNYSKHPFFYSTFTIAACTISACATSYYLRINDNNPAPIIQQPVVERATDAQNILMAFDVADLAPVIANPLTGETPHNVPMAHVDYAN